MAPGKRVSQLMNIAFDMAAWVSSANSIKFTCNTEIQPTLGNFGQHEQRVYPVYSWQNLQGMESSHENCGYCHRLVVLSSWRDKCGADTESYSNSEYDEYVLSIVEMTVCLFLVKHLTIQQIIPILKQSLQQGSRAHKVMRVDDWFLGMLICIVGLADSWSRSAHFYNSCGPTEVTIFRPT